MSQNTISTTSQKKPQTIAERVADARAGKNLSVICKLESGWVVVFDHQPVDGYCLLISDPIVASLNELPEAKRLLYCRDMARVGDALLETTGAIRINYETWCNVDPSLHTHIVPRFAKEPTEKRLLPVGKAYDFGASRSFDPSADAGFIARMRELLSKFE